MCCMACNFCFLLPHFHITTIALLRAASECTSPAAIKSPSSSIPLTDVTDSQSSEMSDLELRTKPAVQDEGVVTDSATLRLSVKDKIKRLSQAKSGTDVSSPAPLSVQQKTSSLPRDTGFNENLTEGRCWQSTH